MFYLLEILAIEVSLDYVFADQIIPLVRLLQKMAVDYFFLVKVELMVQVN
jgi:hypothetical protein